MSERTELPRTLSSAIPVPPIPTAGDSPVAGDDETRERIATLEREARALGPTASAALLYHEIGLAWESVLKHPRNAAVAYQAAFKLAPRFVANIRAARRLFSEVGNWIMVVQLLEAEHAAAGSPRAQAALLFEKAQVLEHRLSREVEAANARADCLALEPQDVTLLVQLEQVFSEKADYPSLVRVYQLMAKALSDKRARAHYLTSAGLLLEDRGKNLAASAELFRQAFALDRTDLQLLAAMKRVAQREGTIDEELAALAAEAESQGAQAAPTFLQISRAYERLGRGEDALAALLAARRIAPKDPLVLAELARIYESQGRAEELAETLTAWGQTNNDENDFVAINLRLASLYEEHLKRDQDAMARYRAILERLPGHGNALAGLGKLCHRLQNWQGLFETYEAEAASTEDPRQKATRIYRAAEVLEERLGRVPDAVQRYNDCLALAPGYLPAQKALSRLYEKLGNWPDLVALYEQDLQQTIDREQKISTLNKIASIHEDRLGDLAKAIGCLKRVLELSPDHLPTMRNLARLQERAGNLTEILALNDHEARLSGDTKQIVSLAHRNAEILEEQLKDRPAAISAWERVLQLSPTYPPALRALGRLYGQDGRWDSLIKMCRAEAEIAPGADQAANLVFRIGELYEQRLKNENEAIASYREVLTLAPNHGAALRALARIYRTQGAWESLIETLLAEAANRTDPTERANAMFQAATIWEDQLKRTEPAIEGYKEVLRLAPTHATALAHLERLITARDDVKELVVLLDRQSQSGAPAGRAAAFVKLARLYLDRLNEPGRAASCCESALAIEAKNLSALRLLERVRANDKPRRAELRNRIAEAWGDERLAAAVRFAPEGQGAPPSPEQLAQLKSSALADPSDETVSLLLERGLGAASDFKGLVELYQRRLANCTDPTDTIELILRVADLEEHQLQDPQRAAATYQTALELAPELFVALAGLARCQLRLGDAAAARATYQAMAEQAKDPASAISALLEAARIAQRVERNEESAAALFRKVLEREPLHPVAGPALEELLAGRGGAPDLVMLHEKRGDAKAAQKDLDAAAAEYFQAAKVCLDSVRDRARGLTFIDRALAVAPSHADALELKGTLALEAQDYQSAAAAWAARIQQGGEPTHIAQLHLRLGALYQDHLEDRTRAATHLQAVVAADPKNTEALERLAEVYAAERQYSQAAECLRQLLDLEPSAQGRARHSLALGKIAEEGFSDLTQAANAYRRALEFTPGDSTALDRLVALYERTGNIAELVRMLEQQAGQAGDPRRATELKLRIAGIYQRQLSDPQRALAAYRQVIDLDSSNIAAHAAMAAIYAREPGSAAMAIETHRTLLRLDPTRVESLRELYRLWEGQRQVDKAFCAASLLSFFRAASEVEQATYMEGKNRLANDFKGVLLPPDLLALHHPTARNALVEVLRAVGDQFVKLIPPRLDDQGIERKADRLKSDQAVFKALQAVATVFGVSEFDAYQAKRGLVGLETTDPLSVLIGPDVVRRFNIREQRFLFGRAALGLYDKAALLRKLTTPEIIEVLGNSVRIHEPTFNGLGRSSEEHSKQLRKAYSRRAIAALREPAAQVAHTGTLTPEQTIQGLVYSFDRAGLLVCADVAAGLGLLLREEAAPHSRTDSTEAVAAAVSQRPELRELIPFAVSDDFFRLRQRIGLSLG